MLTQTVCEEPMYLHLYVMGAANPDFHRGALEAEDIHRILDCYTLFGSLQLWKVRDGSKDQRMSDRWFFEVGDIRS